MDNLESLREEEKKLSKNKRILHFAWAISITIISFLILFIADLKPLEVAPFFVVYLITYLMWWKTKTKVEKI